MPSDQAAAGRLATGPVRRGAPALACAALLALAACDRGPPPAAPDARPVPADPAKAMSPPDLEGVTASYRCDQGHRIDVVRGKVARVALADGRVLGLEAVRDSTPPTFMDHGLVFSQVSGTAAMLDDEKGNTVSCTRIDTAPPG